MKRIRRRHTSMLSQMTSFGATSSHFFAIMSG